jgi:hypothetical protein
MMNEQLPSNVSTKMRVVAAMKFAEHVVWPQIVASISPD